MTPVFSNKDLLSIKTTHPRQKNSKTPKTPQISPRNTPTRLLPTETQGYRYQATPNVHS